MIWRTSKTAVASLALAAILCPSVSLANTYMSGVQVFSGAAPTVLTTLDLSAQVGAATTTVVLMLQANSASSARYNFYNPHFTGSCNVAGGASNLVTITSTALSPDYIVVQTDEMGHLSWCSNAANSVNITLLSWEDGVIPSGGGGTSTTAYLVASSTPEEIVFYEATLLWLAIVVFFSCFFGTIWLLRRRK